MFLKAILIILLFSISVAKAQDISYFENEKIQNEIKKLGYSQVEVNYQFKAENQRIIDKGFKYKLTFNKKGKATTAEFIKQDFYTQKIDTTTHYKFYDKKDRLYINREKKSGQYIYKTEYFEYDSLDNLIKRSIAEETNQSDDALFFKIAKQKITFTEKFGYEYYSKLQFKRIYYNDIDQPYKYEVLSKNKNLTPLSEWSKYIITSLYANCDYKYDTNGLLIEKTFTGNASGEYNETYIYKYKDGKIDSEIFKADGTQKYEKFYFYSAKGLLESTLQKYPDNSIDIVNFKYGF